MRKCSLSVDNGLYWSGLAQGSVLLSSFFSVISVLAYLNTADQACYFWVTSVCAPFTMLANLQMRVAYVTDPLDGNIFTKYFLTRLVWSTLLLALLFVCTIDPFCSGVSDYSYAVLFITGVCRWGDSNAEMIAADYERMCIVRRLAIQTISRSLASTIAFVVSLTITRSLLLSVAFTSLASVCSWFIALLCHQAMNPRSRLVSPHKVSSFLGLCQGVLRRAIPLGVGSALASIEVTAPRIVSALVCTAAEQVLVSVTSYLTLLSQSAIATIASPALRTLVIGGRQYSVLLERLRQLWMACLVAGVFLIGTIVVTRQFSEADTLNGPALYSIIVCSAVLIAMIQLGTTPFFLKLQAKERHFGLLVIRLVGAAVSVCLALCFGHLYGPAGVLAGTLGAAVITTGSFFLSPHLLLKS